MNKKNQIPILYSFRRCPYAIRARLAIKASKTRVELREILLSEKPDELLACSKKATVPVLQLADATIIDESRDIMEWALMQSDPEKWLPTHTADVKETNRLIRINDNEFKQHLDHYKYADRFPEKPIELYRQKAEHFLQILEDKLNKHTFLLGNKITFVDVAIFPFIRQFAYVDKAWFDHTPYQKLQIWLDLSLSLNLFNEVMKKYPRWQAGDVPQYF